MTRKKRRALLCMLAVPLLALAPRSEESLPASAAEPAAVPEKYVALTFDDGPWSETTEQLLDGLAERGAKATFFLIGEQIAGHEDTVRRMADEGVCKSRRDKLTKVDVIADDAKLIEIYIAVVKEMCVKYGIAVNKESGQ